MRSSAAHGAEGKIGLRNRTGLSRLQDMDRRRLTARKPPCAFVDLGSTVDWRGRRGVKGRFNIGPNEGVTDYEFYS